MGDLADPADGLGSRNLPLRGLEEVLTAWSSGGVVRTVEDLLLAVSEKVPDVSQVRSDRQWTVETVQQRANRIVWSLIRGDVANLPESVHGWLEALPAKVESRRVVSDRFVPPVDWMATALVNRGWPPPAGLDRAQFVAKRRERNADDLLASALRWFQGELAILRDDAAGLWGDVRRDLVPQVEALAHAVDHVGPGPSAEPGWAELEAIAAAGGPWIWLRKVADELVRLKSDPQYFCMKVLWPDAEMRGRLFHLAVYGELLVALKERGYNVKSVRPLTGSASSPTHLASKADAPLLEVWFEAAGAWSSYKQAETSYRRAVGGRGGVLSPDCLLVSVGAQRVPTAALVLECKDSLNASYAIRDGYLQALAYGVEMAINLGVPTSSYSVAPSELVRGTSGTELFEEIDRYDLTVGLCAADSIGAVLDLNAGGLQLSLAGQARPS